MITSTDIVPVVRAAGYAKYDKVVHSFVTHSDERGVTLRPEAMHAVAEVYPEFAVTLPGYRKPRKKPRRRKANSLRCRLDDTMFRTVKRWMHEDGWQTQQEFLEAAIRDYGTIHGKNFL